MKSFNFVKLAKICGKRDFLKQRRSLIQGVFILDF